jgi:hypothetical protein
MRKTLLVLSTLAVWFGVEAAQAKEDKCKICRDYHAACVKAHTKEACQSELNICLKHCLAPK